MDGDGLAAGSGSDVVLREVWRGRIWTLRPATLAQDNRELVAPHLAPGTRCKHPRGPDGELVRLPGKWRLLDDVWLWSTLRLHAPGTGQEVWPARRDPHSFSSGYVNLQEPLRRTTLGFDYMD